VLPEAETLARPVELIGDCPGGGCLEFALNLHKAVMDRKYRVGASIMETPETLSDWRAMHRTARKRADRCERLGYRFAEVDYSLHSEEMFAINTSLPTRQGRPMSDGYLKNIKRGKLPDFPCAVHRTTTYGVMSGQRLVAYMTLHRAGELALVSMILGHGDHLQNDVMYLLFQGIVENQAGLGGILYYNRWDSGREGLRFFKERLGFSEGSLEWIL
jgi:hypothetical protein